MKNIKHEWLFTSLLLALGFALRLVGLSSLPRGLNQDEASALYDAWAILHFGIDRCGNSFPVLLEAWGSGQNALLSYLAMPFVALLGPSPLALRLPMALYGSVALVFFWLFARRARGQLAGLAALFLLALNPWHIMSVRWGLESNLLPAFLMAGIYFTAAAKERPWALLPAAALFGLSLYAYGTAYFFLPVFLVAAVIWLRKDIHKPSFFVSLAVFIAIALPISVCQLRNALGLPALDIFGVTLPALTESRQSAVSVFGGGGFRAIGDNFVALLQLLVSQSDGLPYNSGPSGGLYYFFGLPLFVVGVFRLFAEKSESELPMAFALGAALLATLFIDVNINRVNMLWLPMIYFMAIGLDFILCKLGRWAPFPVLGIVFCFSLFYSSYYSNFGKTGYSGYFPGLGEAIEFVAEQEPESAYISHYVNQPYIFALLYTETPPGEFIGTVDYINPDGAFRWVRSFSCWRFGEAGAAEGEYLILHRSEGTGRDIVAVFGEYIVSKG